MQAVSRSWFRFLINSATTESNQLVYIWNVLLSRYYVKQKMSSMNRDAEVPQSFQQLRFYESFSECSQTRIGHMGHLMVLSLVCLCIHPWHGLSPLLCLMLASTDLHLSAECGHCRGTSKGKRAALNLGALLVKEVQLWGIIRRRGPSKLCFSLLFLLSQQCWTWKDFQCSFTQRFFYFLFLLCT